MRSIPLGQHLSKLFHVHKVGKNQHFVAMQESTRKDVERAFVVLQARFAIIRESGHFWDEETLANIMKACIILHNMIIEDEGSSGDIDFDGYDGNMPTMSDLTTSQLEDFVETVHGTSGRKTQDYIGSINNIRDNRTHSQLQADLVEHLWQLHGQ